MNFLKKIFGNKSDNQPSAEPSEYPENYVKHEEGVYIVNKDAEPVYTYTDLTDLEYKQIAASVEVVREAFAPLFKFDHQPANHPINLDEYLSSWGSSGFGDFLGIEADQHAAFLAYNFGQFLVETYGMKWQTKSDGHGTQTVVRMESPVEIELYPIDRTLRGIQDRELAFYQGINEKLGKAMEQFAK
jgi:hypothetical protein